MPTVRKLAPEEVQVVEGKRKGPRRLTEEQYDGFLSEFTVGEYGEAELGADEKRLTVRNRFKAAAARRGVGIDFKRTQGNIIQFTLIASGGDRGKGAPKAVPEVVSSEPLATTWAERGTWLAAVGESKEEAKTVKVTLIGQPARGVSEIVA